MDTAMLGHNAAEISPLSLPCYASRPPGQPSIGLILREVARHFDVSLAQILGPRRKARLVYPRQVAMYLAYVLRADLSLPTIGAMLRRDHTTVLHGHARIERRIAESEDVALAVAAVQNAIDRAVRHGDA